MKNHNAALAKSASRDFILSVLGLVLYNGVLQLLVYPKLGRSLGSETFGTALYYISAASILGMTFGSGASYARMVAHGSRTETNGDYNRMLLGVFLLSIPIALITALAVQGRSAMQPAFLACLLLIFVLTILRYYSDVAYRMNLHFGRYLLYYVALAAGNLLGLLLLPLTGSWIPAILLGEAFAVLFTALVEKIYRPPFLLTSADYKANLRAFLMLTGANLVSAVVLHADRILLRLLVGGTAVTVFYAASLIGKIAALMTTPFNGILISYMTRYHLRLTRKKFLGITGIFLLLILLGTAVCSGVSVIFVRILYPDVYEMASAWFVLANAGQICYFLSGSLMVIVLNFTKEKLQLTINLIYLAVFALLVIPMTWRAGLAGMAIGLCLVNGFRFLLTAGLGLHAIRED